MSFITEKVCQCENNLTLESNQRILFHDKESTDASEQLLCAFEHLKLLHNYL